MQGRDIIVRMPELTADLVMGTMRQCSPEDSEESCTSKYAEMILAGDGRGPGSLVMLPGSGSGTALPVARTRTSSTCFTSHCLFPPMPSFTATNQGSRPTFRTRALCCTSI